MMVRDKAITGSMNKQRVSRGNSVEKALGL